MISLQARFVAKSPGKNIVTNSVFLDTNIVADIIDSSRKNHVSSVKILEQLIEKQYEICICEDMITTLYYILDDKENALRFIRELVLVDWTVLTFGTDTIKEAIDIALSEQKDLEDILQCLCAKKSGCHMVITNDKKFYDCGIDIVKDI